MTAPLSAGLYLVATPIGSARDITLRALDILAAADVLAAEDTRNLRHLLQIHGIALNGRRILPYHDHNGPAMRPRLVAAVGDGKSVAYASDAGTPLVADPGYRLVRAMTEAGHDVTGAPGPSSVLAALALAGLPTDRFLFAGFLPGAQGARAGALRAVADVPASLVFFETAQRCLRSLREILAVLGDREAALCRELTKRFEEVRRGRVSHLIETCESDPPRGEIVIVLDRDRSVASEEEVIAALDAALATMSVKDAARSVAERLSMSRREVYQLALSRGAGK